MSVRTVNAIRALVISSSVKGTGRAGPVLFVSGGRAPRNQAPKIGGGSGGSSDVCAQVGDFFAVVARGGKGQVAGDKTVAFDLWAGQLIGAADPVPDHFHLGVTAGRDVVRCDAPAWARAFGAVWIGKDDLAAFGRTGLVCDGAGLCDGRELGDRFQKLAQIGCMGHC